MAALFTIAKTWKQPKFRSEDCKCHARECGLQSWGVSYSKSPAEKQQWPDPGVMSSHESRAQSPNVSDCLMLLACLPGPGDLSFQLLSHSRMNTGLQKFPALQPLPTQAATKAGLLAIVKVPAKSMLEEFDGTRARSLPEAIMNPPEPCATVAPSILPQPQAQALAHQQALQQAQTLADAPPQRLRHPQGIPPPQAPSLRAWATLRPCPNPGPGPPSGPVSQGLQHPPTPLLYGGRKMPDSDDPLNVTGSTSTIALSMAATLQQSQPLDLSCIVQQINQVCQTRAGISTASVCEGQLADPSPSSHSLLINANTQVSTHSVPTPHTHTAALPTAGPVNLPMGISRAPTNQQQLAPLQQICGEASGTPAPGLTGKHVAGRELAGPGFPQELCLAQSFHLKPPWRSQPHPHCQRPGSPTGLPQWSLLPTPVEQPQGLTTSPCGSTVDILQAHPSTVRGLLGPTTEHQNSLMQTVDYLSGDVQQACFREQSLAMLSKAHRAPGNRALIL
ncbi:Protein FAM222B [Camelus dromedarius]|uniref:Protein FAM222B n=1 Tax=Camelus dromedarius TaxID=9838 RepID=A0A5N4DXE5_CAMDR|nr:Protein FAM222B [Camelus dromedarius]